MKAQLKTQLGFIFENCNKLSFKIEYLIWKNLGLK